MRSTASKRRSKHLPVLPDNPEDIEIPAVLAQLSYKPLQPGQPIVTREFFRAKLIIHGVGGRIETVLIFVTNQFFQMLINTRRLYGDGDFFVAPQGFKQVKLHTPSILYLCLRFCNDIYLFSFLPGTQC